MNKQLDSVEMFRKFLRKNLAWKFKNAEEKKQQKKY